MTLKSLLKLASYKGTDFFDKESIGLIARGPSSKAIEECNNKFNHCFLAGEFNNNIDKIGVYLKNKDIVLSIVQTGRYRTPPDKCKRYNIKNVQIIHQYGTSNYYESVKRFLDIKVVGYTEHQVLEAKEIFKEDMECKYGIWTTGIAGLFHASYFRPKKLYVMGIDFYNEDKDKYSIPEDHDILDDTVEISAERMRDGMLKNFYSICDFYSDVEYIVYTTFPGIKSGKNIKVIEI